MKYHFKVHKEKNGYWSQCIELPGCITEADSLAELHTNMEEALNLFIEEPEDSKDLAPLPDLTIRPSKNILEVTVDSEVAFAFMVRYNRIRHGLTQKQAAKKIGFESLYSYQRLETRRCNPSLKVITKIKQAFPEFSIDYTISS